MRRAAALVAAVAAVALNGCGGGAGELITIATSGGGGDNHRFVVTGDGRGTCDGRDERVLPSQHVLDAREVERELKDPAKRRASYTAGPPGARRYVASTKNGIVTWVEGARGAPPVVAKGIVLVQELKGDLCPGAESKGP
jgi:hypothetical protein